MESEKAKRTALRKSFTVCTNNIEKAIKDGKSSTDDFIALQKLLNDKFTRLTEIQEIVSASILNNEDLATTFEKDFDEAETYRDKYSTLSTILEKIIINSASQEEGASQIDVLETTKMRLPKIELVKFNGDIKEWLKFWSQFKRIHEDVNLHKEDKFQYLIQSMVVGTRVRDLVDGYPPTAENYDKCIDSLRMRFGREELLIEFYVRELLSLVIKNVTNSRSKGGITQLYDQLESHLRSLESIGMTSDKYAAMLLPLVESCIPEDILRIWLRNPSVSTTEESYGQRLAQLLKFLRLEVESEQRVLLAKSGFKPNDISRNKTEKSHRNEDINTLPTSAALVSTGKEEGSVKKCIFCSKSNHKSSECYIAQKMSLTDRKSVVIKSKACFKCLKEKHSARFCRNKNLHCGFCNDKWHHILLCPKKDEELNKIDIENAVSNTLSNQTQENSYVYLQTIPLKVSVGNRELVMRCLLDSGSENSYITQRVISKLSLKSIGKQTLIHGLFGGRESNPKQHSKYNIKIKSLKSNFSCRLEVLSEEKICGNLPKITDKHVISELQKKNIYVPDVGSHVADIDLLLGADALGFIYTGKLIKLECGLTAVETHLGFVLMGRDAEANRIKSLSVINEPQNSRLEMSMLSNQILSLDIKELWRLETIGIRDPVENLRGRELISESIKRFENGLDILPDGRYQLKLPFKIENSLTSNKCLAWKRHQKMCQRIIENNCFDDYVSVFKEWENLGIIERVPGNEINNDGYYLPHRPVLTPTKTTKIRPVFDATAREGGKPSLNDVLHKGPNLIELIPDILDRFRLYPIGLSADIEKAFLQLAIAPEHREFLRFFYPHEGGREVIYRHCRVVFGVCSSPFLLAASLNHLLEHSSLECTEIISKLKHSFYVDNCVSGVFNKQEVGNFISSAKAVLSKACFNLRNWESNVKGPGVSKCTGDTNLLGIIWNLDRDTLRCSVVNEIPQNKGDMTKRTILSFVQQFYDPIGILSAATLLPKIWLQEAWKMKLAWDDPLPSQIYKRFSRWLLEVACLSKIEIPRYVNVSGMSELHVFTDASKYAYAACIFIRSVTNSGIQVSLIRTKTRVAPIKTISIPRLELLACSIGARLAHSVRTALDLPHLKTTFWTDSMVALWWIKNQGEWSIFVSNRVREINEVFSHENWRHVPGISNPADILSRGCSPQQLLDLRCFEGPAWLKKEPGDWPMTKIDCEVKEVNAERRKVALCSVSITEKFPWYAQKFSDYHSIIRMVAWIKRFIANCYKRPEDRNNGEISNSEFENAEKTLIRSVQRKYFTELRNVPIISVFEDKEGLLRVKTRITERKDDPCFLTPILLPANCVLTTRIVEYYHKTNCHAGTQILLSIIREKYWILKSRKTVRQIIRKCLKCRRYSTGPAASAPVALPEDRVRDAKVFEVTGIDLAGPLFLLNGDKVWIVLFTCAVFRAIHLELVTSLSSASFLLSLRRFIARRGRPKTIYTDNGSNFRGAATELQNLDWAKIQRETELQGIRWKFIPPTAAWWGGWWERLIRVIKDLLRRILGRSILSYEELLTVCCDCEGIINSRPLTYISEDSEDLTAITPAMFLMTNASAEVTDLDLNDFAKFQRRVRFRAKLFKDLKSRFRKEYLGLLVQKRSKPRSHKIKSGDIVLVENPNKKRLYWPLAKVIELLPGKDGNVRTLRLKCGNTEIIRPIQRIYPLEIQPEELPIAAMGMEKAPELTNVIPAMDTCKFSRCGRKIKPPQKLDLLNLTVFFES